METVWRPDSSPYLGDDFVNHEKSAFLKAGNFKYFGPSDSMMSPAKIVITNTHTDFTNPLLQEAELIIHANSGYDNIPLDFVTNFNGPLILGNEIRAKAVASSILSCFWKHFSTFPDHKKWDKKRSWKRKDIGKINVGLIGYGQIGKLVESSLNTMVSNVQIYDPYKGYDSKIDFSNCDCLVLACGLNKLSRGLIGKSALEIMPNGSAVINMARGKLINQKELLDVLAARRDMFAFLDVFEREPSDFSQFSKLENIQLSSHIAGVYNEIAERTIEFNLNKTNEFLKNPNKFKSDNLKIDLQSKIIGDMLI